MMNLKGLVIDINEKADMTPLAEGFVTYKDFNKTGVNQNIIVVGSTGCGKTTSITEPDLLHNYNSSEVIPVSKQIIVNKYKDELKRRGFRTEVINFFNADEGTIGYDPMDYINSVEDAIDLAKQFSSANKRAANYDPYWENAAESAIAAIIMLVKINAEYAGCKPKFKDVITLLKMFKYKPDANNEVFNINLMSMFEESEKHMPDNAASELINSVSPLPERTAMCVYSTIKSSIDKILSENVEKIVEKREKIDFKRLGDEKTVLFVVTNPFNETCSRFINIMYSQMFKSLFEKAESSSEGHLDIPVHVICDDFACGTRIQNFENYISIFRQAGISVTILLQSESQLSSLYDEHAATTILNNSDTYVFMGSLDDKTVLSISKKMNLPYDRVMHMPLEQVMVMRRGHEPFVGRRYQLFEDPVYKRMMCENDN